VPFVSKDACRRRNAVDGLIVKVLGPRQNIAPSTFPCRRVDRDQERSIKTRFCFFRGNSSSNPMKEDKAVLFSSVIGDRSLPKWCRTLQHGTLERDLCQPRCPIANLLIQGSCGIEYISHDRYTRHVPVAKRLIVKGPCVRGEHSNVMAVALKTSHREMSSLKFTAAGLKRSPLP
jgi:hypothetical protein